jgi:hypothetical protein
MTEQEKALLRKHYEFQMELFNAQGAEIERVKDMSSALTTSINNLTRMHRILGEMMQITNELIRPS